MTPVILVNSDEEIGSRESTLAIRALASSADRAMVLEPSLGTQGALKTARKGLGRYTVTVHGKAAHAGLDPTAGASAILELSSVIQRLFALNDHDRGVTVNVGMVSGGIQPNVIAPESSAVIDVRVLTNEDAETVDAAIRALQPSTPGTSLTVDGGMGRPPLERTERNAALYDQAVSLATQMGLSLPEATAGGGSDGNTASQVAPTLDGLGAVGDGAHAEHERVYVPGWVQRTALLAGLLLLPAVRATPVPTVDDPLDTRPRVRRRSMSTGTATRIVPTTVTRIADIDSSATSIVPISRHRWDTGDYVVGRVTSVSRALHQVELPNGRMADVACGELVTGALGRRAATLEAVGDWRDVTDDGHMHLLTSAGLMGRATSVSPFLPPLVALDYVGHLHLHGEPTRMRDWVVPAPAGATFDLPVVLVIGTSMSAGKTESAKVVVSLLRDLGRVVVGAKLTGAARYRDPLAMWDAGATAVYDFVDAGLPSTAVPVDDYVAAMLDGAGSDGLVRRRRRGRRGGGIAAGGVQRCRPGRPDRESSLLHRPLCVRPLRRRRPRGRLRRQAGRRRRGRGQHDVGCRAGLPPVGLDGPQPRRPAHPPGVPQRLERHLPVVA